MHARVLWHGQEQLIAGTLDRTFLLADEQVMVRLLNVRPTLEGNDDTDVWVPARALQLPDGKANAGTPGHRSLSVVLRSDIREIPAGQARDYALRTLTLTLAEFVGKHGVQITLAPGVGGTHELSFTMNIPCSLGTDYLWKFQLATRQCRTQPALWKEPPTPLADASLQSRNRSHAAHYTGQLPLWLTTRRFWSVFRWHNENLQHIVQFSLPDKLQRTLVRRFRLRMK